MKIWIITGEFAPDFGGGIGTYVENCAKMFQSHGDEVTVIVKSLKKSIVETAKEGYRIVRFKIDESADYYQYLGYENGLAFQYYLTVMDMIEKYGKPDVIETQEYNAYGQYLIQNKLTLKSELQDIPIVVHLHTPAFETLKINQYPVYRLPEYWIGEMEKACIKGADGLLCPSQFLADILQPMTDNKINVINLPFVYDESDFNKYKEKEKDFKTDKKTILYFGRSEYRKGVMQLVEACSHLWDKGIDFKLKMIGGDTKLETKNEYVGEILKDKYEKYIDSDNLEMLDSIPHLELIPHILSSTAVVIPSLYENFPNTCIESMFLGKTVLVSKSGGQAEMVEESGKNGYIFDWDKDGDFEEKLENILELDESELNRIGENARKRIVKLTNLEDNYKMRKEFFENVIKNHKNKTEFPFLNSMPMKKIEKDYKGQKDLLSVVITYYNLGDTLPETIQSIKDSEYENYEIIIVNDGSYDENSIKQLDNYRNDPKIRIIDIKNAGLANARNVGAKEAKGEYIAFLDADDLVDPTFYTKAIKILKRYSNVSYVYSWVKYFEGSDGVWPTFNIQIPYLLCSNMLAAFVVIRKNDFMNFGMNRSKMIYGMEDYDSWISLAQAGRMGVSIPELLNLYRIRKDSMSRGFNEKNRIFLYQRMTEGHEEIYKEFFRDVYMLLLTNGEPFYWSAPCLPVPTRSSEGEAITPEMMHRLNNVNRFFDTVPGKASLKVYRGMKKVKNKISKK